MPWHPRFDLAGLYQSNSGPTEPSSPPMNPSRDMENCALTRLVPHMSTSMFIDITVVKSKKRGGERLQ
jgi:hypothetical protein